MDVHEDHLRNLLDQRSASSERHSRFPSLSEFSDSPSVYSHAYCSPRPLDKRDIDAHASSFNFEIPAQYAQAEPRSPISNRERLLNDPTSSSLDLDDESSSASVSRNSYGEEDEEAGLADDDDASLPRMSLLGPKMRFHSRAPWETGEDSVEEDEDSDHSEKSGVFGKRGRGKASKAEALMRSFGGGRASSGSRPSGESAHSQPRAKASFEASAANYSGSRGGLYALAHASMSTSSLSPASASSNNGPPGARQNFSLPRTGQYPPSGLTSNQTQSISSACPPIPRTNGLHLNSSPVGLDIHSFPVERHEMRTSSSSSRHQPSHEEFVHPYANPELVVSYASGHNAPPVPHSPHRVGSGSMTTSDSTATVTATLSSRSATLSTMTADTSASSLGQKPPQHNHSLSRVTAKDISTPISVKAQILRSHDVNSMYNNDQSGKLTNGIPVIPGWVNPPTSPTVTLISLQEAQAIARERSRSATVSAVVHPQRSDATPSHLPFPEVEESTGPNALHISPSHPSPSSSMTRVRARSISAGARARNALHSIVGMPVQPKPERLDFEPVTPITRQHGQSSTPGSSSRLLKHKKSGFMRLFNGREREKERLPPPPVPSLSDVYAASHPPPQPQSTAVPRTPKLNLQRVPVPSLSPSILQEVSPELVALRDPPHSAPSDISSKSIPPPKPSPPPLSIVTAVPTSQFSASTPASESSSDHSRSSQPNGLAPVLGSPPLLQSPKSAPPGSIEFPTLQLRPMSTQFSAQFAEVGVASSPNANKEQDLDTPSSLASLGAVISPLTPMSFGARVGDGIAINENPSIGTAMSGDPSAVIQALQEQMISAKKAWQRQIWELEGQVRDLKFEMEDLRASGEEEHREYCEVCGRGDRTCFKDRKLAERGSDGEMKKVGVVNRPRARTGDAARFGSGH